MCPAGRWPPSRLSSGLFALHLSSGEVTAVGRLQARSSLLDV